jgi:hypothetical protein
MMSMRESADDYARIVAILNDRWRVIECPDRIQWILQHRGSPEMLPGKTGNAAGRGMTMPAIENVADAKMASAALLTAVSAGSLTPSEAAEVSKLIDAYVKAIEVTEVLAHLEKLEQRL